LGHNTVSPTDAIGTGIFHELYFEERCLIIACLEITLMRVVCIAESKLYDLVAFVENGRILPS